jgi:membrane-associated phospholipid phosphatase
MDQLRPWLDKHRKEIAFFAGAILVIVIGVIVPGGVGNVIQGLGGLALAIGILVVVGISARPRRPKRERGWPYTAFHQPERRSHRRHHERL